MNNFSYSVINSQSIDEKIIKKMYDVETNSGANPYKEEVFKSILTHNTNLNFVCLNGENIVGVLTINLSSKKFGGSIYIINISVKKECQKMGIATKLILKAFAYIKNNNLNNYNQVFLEVDKSNLPALNLYQKLGFNFVQNYQDDEQYAMSAQIDELLKPKCKKVLDLTDIID